MLRGRRADRTWLVVLTLVVTISAWCAHRSVILQAPWLTAASIAVVLYGGVLAWLYWREL